MDEKFRKLIQLCGAWSGLIGILFLGLGWALCARMFPPWRPLLNADQLTADYHDHALRIRIGMLLCMVAAIILLIFAATITTYVARFEGRFGILSISTAMSGFANAMFTYFGALWWMVLVFRPRSPELTQLFSDLSWLTFLGGGTISGFLFLVPGLMAFLDKSPTPVFPRWLGWLTGWFLIGAGPGELLFLFKDGVFAWNGVLGFYVPATLFMAWLGSVTYCLNRAARMPSISAQIAPVLADPSA